MTAVNDTETTETIEIFGQNVAMIYLEIRPFGVGISGAFVEATIRHEFTNEWIRHLAKGHLTRYGSNQIDPVRYLGFDYPGEKFRLIIQIDNRSGADKEFQIDYQTALKEEF